MTILMKCHISFGRHLPSSLISVPSRHLMYRLFMLPITTSNGVGQWITIASNVMS